MVRPRYVEHRDFDRLRHSRRFRAFLDAQALRLGITAEEVFELLKQFTYEQLPALEFFENDTPPSITGDAEEGQTLTYVPGVWSDDDEVTWQWVVDGSVVQTGGATLVILPEWIGETVLIRETAKYGPISKTVSSAPTETIIETTLENTVLPTVTGDAEVGATLTYVAGTWTDDDSVTHEWFIDDESVQEGGATLDVIADWDGLSGFVRETALKGQAVKTADSAAFGPIVTP